MALVVLLRGVNVGGHKRFRPTTLAAELEHLGAVNIGAAGTFVIHEPIGRTELRAEIAERLPFEAEIVICRGRDVARLVSREFFEDRSERPDVVRFVSVLSRRPRSVPRLPMRLPSSGDWMLEILARDDRFVVGVHRRQMKAIRYLGELDRIFGAAATTRSWNTMKRIAKALDRGRAS